jgi:hypothetical protein
MLALVEKYPDLGQDLAKYVLEREQQKVPDTIKQESAGYLVRCKRFHVSCAILCRLQQTPCPVAWVCYPLKRKIASCYVCLRAETPETKP